MSYLGTMKKVLQHRPGLWMAMIALVMALVLAFSLYLHPSVGAHGVGMVSEVMVKETPRALSPESLVSAVVETMWKAVFPQG